MSRQKHNHYQALKAYADGWEIQFNYKDEWIDIKEPSFNLQVEYRIKPSAEGWLPWYGGKCPVDPDTKVEVEFANTHTQIPTEARWWSWDETDSYRIIAYRVVQEPVDPYAEFKDALEDPTKEVGFKNTDGHITWGTKNDFGFNFKPERYVFRNKPKKS